jgi:hypothetical protein
MDSDTDAARIWVEEASPDYLVLVDNRHLLSSLYNMVNVPQAVWINEDGRIVRPTESGGSIDILREFDMETMSFKPESMERAGAAKSTYEDAVRDWAINGSDSQYVFDTAAARDHVEEMTSDIAEAHTLFVLGEFLGRNGGESEAAELFARCRELHPDSWNIFRQTTEKMDSGIAAGEEFWGKVMSLGDKEYYRSVDMPGMP